MAALTVRAVKLAIFSGAAVPLIGFTGRLSALSDEDEIGGREPQYVRVCDIPLHRMANRTAVSQKEEEKSEPNVVQTQITNIRIFSTGIINQLLDGYDGVKTKVQIGVDHSKATLDYVQNNPGELPRVALISLATMGGVVVGYRGSILRKFLYASIAGLSSAALCYPNHSVDLSNAIAEDAKSLWKGNIGWPLSDSDSERINSTPKVSMKSESVKTLKIKEDPGQSQAEDKDLYSTRSS